MSDAIWTWNVRICCVLRNYWKRSYFNWEICICGYNITLISMKFFINEFYYDREWIRFDIEELYILSNQDFGHSLDRTNSWRVFVAWADLLGGGVTPLRISLTPLNPTKISLHPSYFAWKSLTLTRNPCRSPLSGAACTPCFIDGNSERKVI